MNFNKTKGGADSTSGKATGPKNIMETKLWQDSRSGVKGIWDNYLNVLKTSFQRMSRAEQEQLISRVSLIVTLGVASLLLMFFYSFLPILVRVFVAPLFLAGAYWAGNKLVTPTLIARFDQYLNRDF